MPQLRRAVQEIGKEVVRKLKIISKQSVLVKISSNMISNLDLV